VANFLVWVVWFFAAFACLASALAVVSFSNPFYSALALIGNLASLAVLYLLLAGEFVAAGQVLVYGGAVMVMFLFVIAYLGDRSEESPWSGGPSWQIVGAMRSRAARMTIARSKIRSWYPTNRSPIATWPIIRILSCCNGRFWRCRRVAARFSCCTGSRA